MSDPALQDGICGQADRILAALRFSGTVDLPVKRAALEQDCAASRWSGHGRPPAPMQRASPRRSGHCRGARTRKADAEVAVVRLPACSQRWAHGGGRIEHDPIPGPMRTDTVDPAFGQVGERRQSSAWVERRRPEAAYLAGGGCLTSSLRSHSERPLPSMFGFEELPIPSGGAHCNDAVQDSECDFSRAVRIRAWPEGPHDLTPQRRLQ